MNILKHLLTFLLIFLAVRIMGVKFNTENRVVWFVLILALCLDLLIAIIMEGVV